MNTYIVSCDFNCRVSGTVQAVSEEKAKEKVIQVCNGELPIGWKMREIKVDVTRQETQWFLTGEGTDHIYRQPFIGDKHEACETLAKVILNLMGDGDNENGGKGSLKNCRDEIVTTLELNDSYSYADWEFRIKPLTPRM